MYYFLSRKETHDFSKAVFQFDAKAMEIYKAFFVIAVCSYSNVQKEFLSIF